MSLVKLLSQDGEVFSVELGDLRHSKTLITMFEDLGFDQEDNSVPIPIFNVSSRILRKVIEWLRHHRDDPVSVYENVELTTRHSVEFTSFDKDLLDVDLATLFAIMMAANYLNVTGLLDMICQVVANMSSDRTPKEIRAIFNIKEDNHRLESLGSVISGTGRISARLLNNTGKNK